MIITVKKRPYLNGSGSVQYATETKFESGSYQMTYARTRDWFEVIWLEVDVENNKADFRRVFIPNSAILEVIIDYKEQPNDNDT